MIKTRAVTQRFFVVVQVEIVDGFPKTKQRSAVIRVWLTKPKTHLLLCLLRHSCISMFTADCERGVQANLLKTQHSLFAHLYFRLNTQLFQAKHKQPDPICRLELNLLLQTVMRFNI